MTQAEFNELPLLLTNKVLLQCGFKRPLIRRLREEGKLTFTQIGEWRRYHKRSVAEVLGLRN